MSDNVMKSQNWVKVHNVRPYKKRIKMSKKDEFKKKRPRKSKELTEEHKERLKQRRDIRRVLRESESVESREARLTKRRERRKRRTSAETDEKREERLRRQRENKRKALKTETEEQRAARLDRLRENQRRRIERETEEQRSVRLRKLREYQRKRIMDDTLAERRARQEQQLAMTGSVLKAINEEEADHGAPYLDNDIIASLHAAAEDGMLIGEHFLSPILGLSSPFSDTQGQTSIALEIKPDIIPLIEYYEDEKGLNPTAYYPAHLLSSCDDNNITIKGESISEYRETSDYSSVDDNDTKIIYKISNINAGTMAEKWLYECNHCGELFPAKFPLQKHLQLHITKKLLKCKHCEKTFKQIKTLKQHEKKHLTKQPLVCEQCGKSFKMEFYLRRHIAAHSEEKSYNCKPCGKSFKMEYYFNRHIAAHSKQKSYNCLPCNKTFKHIRFYDNHITIHHKEERSKT